MKKRPTEWVLSTQIPAYENAVSFRALNETEWLVLPAIHRFLVPPNANNLLEVLEQYKDYPGINLVSDFFDASQSNILPRRKLLVQTVELTKTPWQNPYKKESLRRSSNLHQCKGFLWPPYQCLFNKHGSKKMPQLCAKMRSASIIMQIEIRAISILIHLKACCMSIIDF